MTTEAIFFMILGWGIPSIMLGFCIVRVVQSHHEPGETPPDPGVENV